jgi:hypothetical protein
MLKPGFADCNRVATVYYLASEVDLSIAPFAGLCAAVISFPGLLCDPEAQATASTEAMGEGVARTRTCPFPFPYFYGSHSREQQREMIARLKSLRTRAFDRDSIEVNKDWPSRGSGFRITLLLLISKTFSGSHFSNRMRLLSMSPSQGLKFLHEVGPLLSSVGGVSETLNTLEA